MSLLSSLTNRIFLGSAILVTVAIGVAIYRVNRPVTDLVEEDLRVGVSEAAALVTDYIKARQANFSTEARLIVDLPVLTNAIATADPAAAQSATDLQSAIKTVQGVALDYAALLSPDLFVVLGRDGRVLARVGQLPAALVSTEDVISARPAQTDTWFWPYPGGLLQVTALPTGGVSAGMGVLVVGFSLDQAAVENIKARTNSDLALVANGKVLASTLDASVATQLAGYASSHGTFDVSLGGDDFIGQVQPLSAKAGSAGGPVAIVLRDRTARLRVLRDIRRDALLTGLAAVLVATLIGYAIARTVTRPLRAITATMGRMAATGDLTQPPPADGRWDDEDARLLARTFGQMTAALDRFRREAAQRERLSSLGRLSTVVAHEVRNPLMIIKSAVRSLRRQPSPEVADIAASIDEEVSRLNRVVTGVLDFARPIRFDLAPADLVEICRDAAQAAQTTADDVPVALAAAQPRMPLVTDAERLRTVLVNVLSNAQQAVHGGSDTPAASPIRLQTSRGPAGGWRIEIIDCGPGIAREHLPRLFEPFFTTRKTGSGLGLALAKNIIEGLGGTITIDSTVGAGTTVRMDVPEHRPVATSEQERARRANGAGPRGPRE